jgi:hypothetical protein
MNVMEITYRLGLLKESVDDGKPNGQGFINCDAFSIMYHAWET